MMKLYNIKLANKYSTNFSTQTSTFPLEQRIAMIHYWIKRLYLINNNTNTDITTVQKEHPGLWGQGTYNSVHINTRVCGGKTHTTLFI